MGDDRVSVASSLARGFVLALALATPVASAAPVATDVPSATCEITFTGSSSLHDFDGTATTTTRFESSATAGKWNVDLVIPVAGMGTDNDSRDSRMREMFEAAKFPEIHVSLRDVDPVAARQTAELRGQLAIHSVARDFVAKLEHWNEDAASVSFDAATTVALSNFGLVAPSVLGLIRVDDEVRVHARVSVHKAPAQDGAGLPHSNP